MLQQTPCTCCSSRPAHAAAAALPRRFPKRVHVADALHMLQQTPTGVPKCVHVREHTHTHTYALGPCGCVHVRMHSGCARVGLGVPMCSSDARLVLWQKAGHPEPVSGAVRARRACACTQGSIGCSTQPLPHTSGARKAAQPYDAFALRHVLNQVTLHPGSCG